MDANAVKFDDGSSVTTDIIKLSLAHFENTFDFTILNTMPNIKCNLRVLVVRDNHIFLDEAEIIANFVAASALNKLTLSHCSMKSQGLVVMMHSIAQSSIRKLKLCCITIDQEGACAIADMLTLQCTPSSLVKLSFVECVFSIDALATIINAVANSTLLTLKLVGICSISDEKLIALINCVKVSGLTKLSLRSTNFRLCTVLTTKMSALVAAIQSSTIQNLNTLYTQLFSNPKDIVDIITCSNITKFKFNQDAFSMENKIEIMNAIKSNAAFRNISFARTPPVDCDAALVCVRDSIECANVNLTHLDISNSCLRTEHMSTIIDHIKRSSIISLNLGNNYLGDDQVVAIMRDLLENHDLQKINVDGMPYEILCAILPSILKSKLIKFKRRSYMDDDVMRKIKKFTMEQKHILNSTCKTKSARHI